MTLLGTTRRSFVHGLAAIIAMPAPIVRTVVATVARWRPDASWDARVVLPDDHHFRYLSGGD